MEQYLTFTDHALWEVIVNGDSVTPVASASAGAEAIPDEHLLKFHAYKDAKSLWEAIKNSQEGLDKIYDRFQKLISQLEIHGEIISQEDANLKLLRSLPSAWNNIALIMRNKSDLDTLSMDDLYNNLKVTNEIVNNAHSVSTASSKDQASTASYVNDVMFSFFTNQSNIPQLDNEDLEHIDADDLEEIDLKWQVAMLTMRVKRFIKNTRRKLDLNGKETVGFNRIKVECYNCHRRGHFAREYMAPRNQGNRNSDALRSNAPVDTSTTNALVVQDGIVSTANSQVSLDSTQVSTTSTQVSTNNLSDATVYAFLANQPNGSQLVHEDLEQIHKDDLEEMDLKWQLALLSMRIRRFFQKTGRKITINGSNTAGYDKSKVECFNCHKMGYFARECRGSRIQDNRNRNQDSSRRTVNVEETSSKAMLAINGAGFDWSYMVDDEVPTNMALMDFLDSALSHIKSRKKLVCLKSECGKALSKKKEAINLKCNFDNASKSLDKLIGSQITDKSRKGMGFESYNVVPPPSIGLFLPPNLDLSNSGLEEFQQPEFEGYGPNTSKSVSEDTSNKVRESLDDPLVEELVSNDKLEKKTAFPTSKIEFVRPKQQEKPVRKPVKYSEMYRSQGPRGNQRNWNNQKSQQLGSDFVMYNKACFVCGSFDHVQAHCNYHQRERVVSGNNYTRTNTVVVNAVRANQVDVVKASACWVWKPTKLSSASITLKRHNYVDARGRSKHMTGNMSYLSDFKEFDEGYVTFGGGAKREKITGKGTLKTGKLDFKDVYFVKELQFNLFSVSQMCDKKSSVLFTDTRCFVLSPDFKLADES
ncbi:ribonuclease H-like domain-containing protein [Tanacetum coccineum]